MEENIVNNVENNGYSMSDNSDDSMFMSLLKLVFVVLIGGLVVKLIKKAKNWFKEGQRLRQEEKQRKEQAKFDAAVEEKAKEMLDTYLASKVEESEKDSKK